ncbi:MAG: hypothetical protein M3Q48_09405 [Actinomycetota bacterium]|nr:hypothetical protein [Actinomycetota bacterium]
MRSITISPFTADVRAGHLERFAVPGLEGLVFPNGAGKPVASSSLWNQHFGWALSVTAVRARRAVFLVAR